MADDSQSTNGEAKASPAMNMDKLVKLLRMTTSDNDNETLMSIRAANRLMESAGWDWEKLIHSKITIVADPFASISEPPKSTREPPRPQPPQNPRAPYARAPSPPPPPPQPVPSPRPNKFDGHCYCCGSWIQATRGMIFVRRGPTGGYDWEPVCAPCASNLPHDKPLTGQRAKKKVNRYVAPDLSSL